MSDDETVYLTKETLPPICDACGELMVRYDWSREANGPCIWHGCPRCKTVAGLFEALRAIEIEE